MDYPEFMNCEHNHIKGNEKKGLVKRIAKGIGLGQLAHLAICPLHGLPGILLKTGLISGAAASPFIAVHDYLVHDIVAPVVSYVRGGEERAEHPHNHDHYHPNSNEEIAHNIVDSAGWIAAIGLPAALIGVPVYRNYRKRKK